MNVQTRKETGHYWCRGRSCRGYEKWRTAPRLRVAAPIIQLTRENATRKPSSDYLSEFTSPSRLTRADASAQPERAKQRAKRTPCALGGADCSTDAGLLPQHTAPQQQTHTCPSLTCSGCARVGGVPLLGVTAVVWAHLPGSRLRPRPTTADAAPPQSMASPSGSRCIR